MLINEVKYEWKGTLIKRSVTEMIVLHHAAAKSCTIKDVHKWHINRGWCGIGYHYFISRDGKIFRGRPENTVGAHATNFNSKSIGVCFEGDYTIQTMPKAQLEAGKELVAYLKDKYKITKVIGHRDLMATSCPGIKFPFDEIANATNNIKDNLVLAFQKAAQADGYNFKQYGCDGIYGSETQEAMKKCVVKKRLFYKYKNCTKLVQRLLGIIPIDGLCGPQTAEMIKKFQKKNNLVADSCCGVNTWKALLKIK